MIEVNKERHLLSLLIMSPLWQKKMEKKSLKWVGPKMKPHEWHKLIHSVYMFIYIEFMQSKQE